MRKFAIALPEFSLEVRDANVLAVDAVDPAFENVDGVVDDLGEGAHGGLSAAVGLCLSPELSDDGQVEVAAEFGVGLFVEYLGEFLLGEEGLLVAVVGLEHLQDAGQVVGLLLHRCFVFIQIQ